MGECKICETPIYDELLAEHILNEHPERYEDICCFPVEDKTMAVVEDNG